MCSSLFTSVDKLVANPVTYTTKKRHKRRTSFISPGFELAIPAIDRPHLDRTATGIGDYKITAKI
jgi:hypothetical protein